MSPRGTGLLLLALAATGWGLNWPMLKLLLEELPPLAARSWGGLAAAAGFALYARAAGISLAVPTELRLKLVVYSGTNVAAWMGLTTIGLVWLKASEGAIAAYTMPIWATLLGFLILKDRLDPARILGLALGVAGVVLLFAGRGVEVGLAKLPGLLLVLAAAVLFAFGTVLSKRWPLPMHPVAAVAWQMLIGCGPLFLLSLAIEELDPAALSTRGWLFLLYMAAVPLGLSYVFWFGALKRLPAATAAIGTLLAPVIGVLGAGLVLGEPLGLREGGALLATLAGVALATRESRRA
ncbi:MAG: EamA family transporter [Acetobacteraceae bacterium]|nr:EamA family transporter [Acetobacteraceae bacterium]